MAGFNGTIGDLVRSDGVVGERDIGDGVCCEGGGVDRCASDGFGDQRPIGLTSLQREGHGSDGSRISQRAAGDFDDDDGVLVVPHGVSALGGERNAEVTGDDGAVDAAGLTQLGGAALDDDVDGRATSFTGTPPSSSTPA